MRTSMKPAWSSSYPLHIYVSTSRPESHRLLPSSDTYLLELQLCLSSAVCILVHAGHQEAADLMAIHLERGSIVCWRSAGQAMFLVCYARVATRQWRGMETGRPHASDGKSRTEAGVRRQVETMRSRSLFSPEGGAGWLRYRRRRIGT